MLLQNTIHEAMTFLEHAKFIIFVHLTEVVYQEDWKDYDNHNKNNTHDNHLVLLFYQEGG